MDSNFTPPPPPLITPPVIQPLPPKPRRSYGWMIVAIILIVLLAFSWLIIFSQAVHRVLNFNNAFNGGFKTMNVRTAGPKLDEFLLEDNSSHNKIAIVTVDGIITSHTADQAGNSMVDVIRAQLDRAKADDRVKAVILKVDSPGGEVMASDQINKLFVKFQNGSNAKPVICSMGSLAASGGYYISAPSRWIVADDLTLTASIGVIMEGLNYRGLMDKIGVQPNVYKSGKLKDMLSGMRETNEIPPEEHVIVQKLIDDTYNKFKGVVRSGREAAHQKNGDEGRALSSDWENYADGRVVSGEQALQIGLVDQLGDFDDAVKHAEDLVHIQNANLIEYHERYDISNFLSMLGQSDKAHDIKFDFGVDIPKLQAGALYFLWQPPSN
jgi:protease-4